jgi:hypothetical protein
MTTTLRMIGGLLQMLRGATAVAATFLLLIVTGLLTQGHDDAAPDRRDTRRSFYLSQTAHDGSQALAACVAGYHMASMFEILDPSHLRYDASLGVTDADAGDGPPALKFGWVRTGRFPSRVELAGAGNCNVWTSSSNDDYGTEVSLQGQWIGEAASSPIEPWSGRATGCFSASLVWCVED